MRADRLGGRSLRAGLPALFLIAASCRPEPATPPPRDPPDNEAPAPGGAPEETAARAPAMRGDPRFARLVEMLGASDDAAALQAASSLERAGADAVPVLAHAMRDGSTLGRYRAARVLANIGEPAGAMLVEALEHTDGRTRFLAAEALARAGPSANAAIGPLSRALGDSSQSVRAAAARALRALGPEGREALEQAAGHPDARVRSAARQALDRQPSPETTAARSAARPASHDLFADVAAERGITFQNANGARGGKYMMETVGFGAAWIDYDRDGYYDLYLVQGHGQPERALDGPGGALEPGNVLYRNAGGKRFEDVTERAGAGDRGYGMGAAAADYDADGWPDLYVTNYGRNTLYRNRGDGTFEDVTADAGVAAGGWSTSAAWADFDADGDLDLYVARYVNYDARRHGACQTVLPASGRSVAAYCDPGPFDGLPDVLYENLGDGTFRDASEESGIARSRGRLEAKGLGVLVSDFDGDGDPDILVANDKVPNTLWRNRGGLRFEDAALETGFALGADGNPQAGMGIAGGDVDGDGRLDYLVTNFSQETNALYIHRDGYFEDATVPSGLAASTFRPLGFGARFLDFDRDGDLDLYVANGHVLDNIEAVRPGTSTGFEQPDLLLENAGRGRFRDISSRAGAWFGRALVGRAVAEADFDNDGDGDLLVTHVAGPAALLENRAAGGKRWIGIELRPDPQSPVVETSRVAIEAGGVTTVHEVATSGSYLSAHDPRLRVGLEGREGPVTVRVRWPGSTRWQGIGRLEPGAYHIIEGRRR